jgi:hypothetical protein
MTYSTSNQTSFRTDDAGFCIFPGLSDLKKKLLAVSVLKRTPIAYVYPPIFVSLIKCGVQLSIMKVDWLASGALQISSS